MKWNQFKDDFASQVAIFQQNRQIPGVEGTVLNIHFMNEEHHKVIYVVDLIGISGNNFSVEMSQHFVVHKRFDINYLEFNPIVNR